MDATAEVRRRTETTLIGNMLLVGAALAVLGNALHPFFTSDTPTEEFLAEAGESAIWVPIHLGVGVSILLLVIALVMFAGHLRATAGATWATVGATLAVVGGGIFTLQIVGIDGSVFPALAKSGADVAVADGFAALDRALLGLSTFVFIGAAFYALGRALDRANLFAKWIRWTAMVGGVAGMVVGLLMLIEEVPAFTFIAFRVVSLAATAVAVGMGVAMRRAPEAVPAPVATASASG